MSAPRNTTRQRLIDAALALFATQGVTETTTKQIAESAEVNEVTLFRHFGNKQGLLLAVIEEAAVFTHLGQRLVQQTGQSLAGQSSIEQTLKNYAIATLQVLDTVPEVVRSVIGEAGQYPLENRQALGQGFTQANRQVAEYLTARFAALGDRVQPPLPTEKLAALLNSLLLGYAVIESTSEFHQLWRDRDDFLDPLVTLFMQGAIASDPCDRVLSQSKHIPASIVDLPTALVHTILQHAKKSGLQDYAMMYVLFGAGLSPSELIRLDRSHHINDAHQQILQITLPPRQVPINQWIMGRRYGSYLRNPLTQWLKSRKDGQTAMFLNEAGLPLRDFELRQRWQALTADQLTPTGQPPAPEQAQQTWCVEILMRGIELENLMILTGWDAAMLQPYIRRAKEKAALEQAMQLDHKA
ncbi:MAG TPA: TetR family transcriptional regulator [Coleofasciculaceae cyanobacterium]|jgi:AcrR family transcriptional regulator/site-specific recombinase XerD